MYSWLRPVVVLLSPLLHPQPQGNCTSCCCNSQGLPQTARSLYWQGSFRRQWWTSLDEESNGRVGVGKWQGVGCRRIIVSFTVALTVRVNLNCCRYVFLFVIFSVEIKLQWASTCILQQTAAVHSSFSIITFQVDWSYCCVTELNTDTYRYL